jgi:hypothetical protein
VREHSSKEIAEAPAVIFPLTVSCADALKTK